MTYQDPLSALFLMDCRGAKIEAERLVGTLSLASPADGGHRICK